jgi:hypothetical protein
VKRRLVSLLACIALVGLASPPGLAASSGGAWSVASSNDQVETSLTSTSSASPRLSLENNVSIKPFGNELFGAVLDALGFGGGYSQTATWHRGSGPAISCPEVLVDLPLSCGSDGHGGGTVLVPDGLRAELALAAPMASGSSALAVAPGPQSLAYDGIFAAISIALAAIDPGRVGTIAIQEAALALQILPEAAGYAAAMKRGDSATAFRELFTLAKRASKIIIDHAVDWAVGAIVDLIPGALEIKIGLACAKAITALANLDAHLLSGSAATTVTVSYATSGGGTSPSAPSLAPNPPQIPGPAAASSPPFGTVVVRAVDWLGGPGVDVYSNGSSKYFCDPVKDPTCKSWLGSGSTPTYVGVKWQCVELTQRFWIAQGWWKQSFGVDASGIWAWAGRKEVNLAETPNGSISAANLAHGDLVVWTTKIGTSGHVAVIDKVAGSDVMVKEQNWGNQTGQATYTLKDGWLSGHGDLESPTDTVHWIAGVVHHPASQVARPVAGGVDLAFAIDTTGSMMPYLDGAKEAARSLVGQVLAKGNARIAVVEYRDFYSDCSIDGFASRVDVGFSTDETAIVAAINGLTTRKELGCDTPESVYSGLMTALRLPWRTSVTKSVVLMGDAPPHDPEPVTGYTLASVKAAAQAVDPASIYTIDIDSGGGNAFADLSSGTGGTDQSVTTPAEAVTAISSSITVIYRTPIATAGGPYLGRAGEPIAFDASGSLSPVGSIATYEWDFNGDGKFDLSTTSPTVTYTYNAPYEGQVVLRVTDNGSPALSALSTTTVSIAPARRATNLVYDGPASGTVGSSAQLSATLSERAGGGPVTNAVVIFSLNGTETCTGTTDSSGRTDCTVTPAEAAGNYTVTASFNGTDSLVESAASSNFAVSIGGLGPVFLFVTATVAAAALLLLMVLAAGRKQRTPIAGVDRFAVMMPNPGDPALQSHPFDDGWSPPTPSAFPGVDGSAGRARAPSDFAAGRLDGQLQVVEGGRTALLWVRDGEQLLLGRAAHAGIRVSDPLVGRRQAMIGRAGGIWVVQDLRATNPAHFLDPSGITQVLSGEVRATSGRLLVGDTIVILLPAGV